MSLPTSYLTSAKNLEAILSSIQQAKAPERFTVRFLEGLGYKSTNDRQIIGVLKSLGMLDDQGKPTESYFEFLDQSQSKTVLASAIESAYADLFEVKKDAQTLEKQVVKNKLKTLSQGQYSDSVVDKMAATFVALSNQADFSAPTHTREVPETERVAADPIDRPKIPPRQEEASNPTSWGGLHYNIQIILPESRDPKVYDALFRSLREHLG